MGCKPSLKIQTWIKSLEDEEWHNSLYDLLLKQREAEVDLFELMCKVLDQNLYSQVEWARSSYYFKETKLHVEDKMQLSQDSWSEMLILDHMHHRMHNNLPDETQLPNGQVISMMAVVVRMRMSIVVLFVRIGIIVPTEQKMWYVEVAKKVVFDLMMDDLFGASRALWMFFNLI